MLKLRKGIILFLNIIYLIFLGYMVFFELRGANTDFVGVLYLALIGFPILANCWFLGVYYSFKPIKVQHWGIEVLFVILIRLDELKKLMKIKNRLNGETIYDNQDLCAMLKLSKRSLQRLRSLGAIPYLQIGQKIFYLESDVEKYIQNQINKKKILGESDQDKSP